MKVIAMRDEKMVHFRSGVLNRDCYVSPDTVNLRCRAVDIVSASEGTSITGVRVVYAERPKSGGLSWNCAANREFDVRATYFADGVVMAEIPSLDAKAFAVDWAEIIALIVQWLLTRKPNMPNQLGDESQVMGGAVILV